MAASKVVKCALSCDDDVAGAAGIISASVCVCVCVCVCVRVCVYE